LLGFSSNAKQQNEAGNATSSLAGRSQVSPGKIAIQTADVWRFKSPLGSIMPPFRVDLI